MRKGDKVEITANIPFPLRNRPRPILGTCINVNGAYVLVRPKYQRFLVDLLDNEVKLINKEPK